MSLGTLEELAKLADSISEINQQWTFNIEDSTAKILKTLIREVNELKIANTRNDYRSRPSYKGHTPQRSCSVSHAR